MKKINILALTFGLLLSVAGFADTGPLFTVVQNGGLIMVTPTHDHFYPNMGIKLTSNNNVSSCTPQNNGFCTFGASRSSPKLLTITGTDTVSGIICLNGLKEYSCQNFTAELIDTPPTPPPPFNLCTGANPTCRVFVSSQTFQAAFGGVAGGNAICQALAVGAGIGGTWAAWLSDNAGTDARSNIGYTAAITYVRARQTTTVVATPGRLSILPLTLDNAILLTEQGITVAAPGDTWTGTTQNGGASANTCTNWTSLSTLDNSAVGSATTSTAQWTSTATEPCNGFNRLYCFEVPT